MNPIQVFRNQAETFTFNVYDDDGDAVDITTHTINFTIHRDIEESALDTIAATLSDPTNGEFTVTISAAISNSLDKLYYPYKIVRNDGTNDTLFRLGIFNVTDPKNLWTWDIDLLTGTTRSELRDNVNRFLRYGDWTDDKLNAWMNDAIQDFCNKTDYISAVAIITTKYNEYEYELPEGMLRIIKVTYLDTNSEEIPLLKNRDWIRQGNKFELNDNPKSLLTVTANSATELQGGQQINVYCTKYAQPLSNDSDYLELPYECEDAITDKTVALAKLEDREFNEMAVYQEKYNAKTQKFIDKAAMDRLRIFTVDTDDGRDRFFGNDDAWILWNGYSW